MSLQTQSHRRRNLLTGEWILVSPHRTERPWRGQVDDPEKTDRPAYDPECYLCPGNVRANGARNPDYRGGFAFDNDFAALSAESVVEPSAPPLFEAEAESGCCRVVCFSEQHHLRLARMDDAGVARALRTLFDEFAVLDARPDINYVQVFENRGAMMGCSNPHPHGQVWATRSIPVEPQKELERQADHYRQSGRPLLLDYLAAECTARERLVCANDHAVSLVPFWACWPYETLLLPRRHRGGPGDLSAAELDGFAQVLRRTLAAAERLFAAAVPYSMGFHPRPSDGGEHPEWQFHAHIYPPLLRSATVRKHMVGFEMLGMPQRDLTPETAAQRLREALAGAE
ncbi:MAG: UDP-glucose--hexose-1-phosphate uridylyltransferase [Xanthomonadales bacterium]